jgi:hypothetical protein
VDKINAKTFLAAVGSALVVGEQAEGIGVVTALNDLPVDVADVVLTADGRILKNRFGLTTDQYLANEAKKQQASAPTGKDLSDELYREYVFTGNEHPYRIYNPRQLFVGKTTHRVLDAAGVVHCVPAPGQAGCVLRWKPKDAANPVQF